MSDVPSWVLSGVSSVAAIASAYFAYRALQAQRGSTEAAQRSAESAVEAQRTQVRPALSLAWYRRATLAGNNVPQVIGVSMRNVGHGTAVIEDVYVLQLESVKLQYRSTDSAVDLASDFDAQIFRPLGGFSLSTLPASIHFQELTEQNRALALGEERSVFALQIPAAHAHTVETLLRQSVRVRVRYRSLGGDLYATDGQFAELRES